MTMPSTRALPVRWRWLLVAAAVGGLATTGMIAMGRGALAQGEGGEGGEGGNAPPPAAAAPVQKNTVRIVFKVYPPTKATVTWGKKKLGFIKPKESLIIQRPRDSGPMDVVVRAENCVPVHTRAYTFTDSVVAVKVTPLDQKNTIYGYKEVPPEDGGTGVPDGGMP